MESGRWVESGRRVEPGVARSVAGESGADCGDSRGRQVGGVKRQQVRGPEVQIY